MCYYTNWSTYRPGISQYDPSDIDPSVCTNIIYSFATLDPNSLTIQVADRDIDIDQGFYKQVTDLKSQGVKVSIAIGGWGDSEGDKYSRMVNSESARANFVQAALEFLREHKFDGLDLNLEYPKYWTGDCDAGPDSDKTNFINLIRELKEAFAEDGFLVSAAVSAARDIGDQGTVYSLMISQFKITPFSNLLLIYDKIPPSQLMTFPPCRNTWTGSVL